MIEFIQDYVTKALPPETFEDGQQVKRSAESELYFVRLGVAGYIHDGQLVGEDYQPIFRKEAVVLVTTDRRFAANGRGGEVIGLEAPQRASTGPGNEAVFAGQPDSLNLSAVEAEQLRGDLAASVAQLDDHRATTTAQIDELTGNLTAVQGEREAALAEAAKAREERDQAVSDLAQKNVQAATLADQVAGMEEKATADAARIIELEKALADKPAKTK